MSFDFINPWMLAGLAGVSLPLLVHLLSRKKFDVVNWGAMQFLKLGKNARRKIRFEELLLMLLRMALIALIAIALARPWLSGTFLSSFASKPACDIAIIIDSSYSSDWRGKASTPHQAEIRWANSFLDGLSGEDTVALIDVRDQINTVIPLTRSRKNIRRALRELPTPSGSSRLHEAVIRGIQTVNSGTNLSRHVIVITDGQSLPWNDTDDHFWLQLSELRDQAAIPPDVWLVNTQKQQARQVNYSIDRLELSRELTVIDFPIRISTTIRNTGAKSASNRRVFLEVDGQRLADRTLSVRVEANGQASAEFEHRFQQPGSHHIRVVLEKDNLPGDDVAEAAIAITDALPVLLVDGTPHPDATKSEVFFAKSALSASVNPTPWVAARSVSWNAMTAEMLETVEVVVLANCKQLTDKQIEALETFVDSGGGLAITLGDRIDSNWFNRKMFVNGAGLSPVKLESLESPRKPKDEDDDTTVRVLNNSLELPWISQFRDGSDDGFLDTRFTNWYRVNSQAKDPKQADAQPVDPADGDPVVKQKAAPNNVAKTDENDESQTPTEKMLSPTIVAARFNNGDPFVVTRQYGRGRVLLLSSTLDADWCTFPAKPDYVAFLHELVFQLASGRESRNVEVGTPLLIAVEKNQNAADWVFIDPADVEHEAQLTENELRPQLRLDETWLPGTYRLRRKGEKKSANDQHFVVNFDRSESDLEKLTKERIAALTEEDRLTQVEQPTDIFDSLKTDNSRVEMWQVLLLVFLAILVGEVVMTRRLVQGGHAYIDPA
jgi:hypothetical protein